jgi:hypothetical protein
MFLSIYREGGLINMYAHHLRDMIDLLVMKKIIQPDQSSEALAVLNAYWEDRIAITWSTGDILGQAKEQGIRITRKRAHEILQKMFHDHDSSQGISWDTINSELQN